MKQVLSDRIIHIPGTDPLESRYEFTVATNIVSPIIIDLANLLETHRNDRVEYRKDYKLWNQVYPSEIEFELFQTILEESLLSKRKVHIINCTLREEIEIIRELYEELGYFNERENRFFVPFSTAPITIGVNIRNLAYSTKDYKSKRESICFIPPPREPWHVKTLFSAINSGIISTIAINDFGREQDLLSRLIESEKMNLTTLAQTLSGNPRELGLTIGLTEKWIVDL